MVRGSQTVSGKLRWQCFGGPRTNAATYCYSTTNPKANAVIKQDGTRVRKGKTPIFKRTLGGVTTLLVSYAQNATPVHGNFVKAMEACANHRSAADILVVPGRYKNPTSRWSASQANDEIWAPEITPYLCNQRKRLNPNLVLLGDLKVQTASGNPLGRKEALTHGESSLIGHPKVASTTVPTPQSAMAKLMSTTGACTLPNYTDTDVGKIGEFHHTIGAALVEIRGKTFHLRRINARRETGEFIDLRDHYTAEGRRAAARAKALVMGDTHCDFIAPRVEKATFGPGGMVDLFEPEILVWHDLDDNHSVNPHHENNFLQALAKAKTGRGDARAELERAIKYVVDKTPANSKSYVIWSNHNEMLMRWFKRTHPSTQSSANGRFWCETYLHVEENTTIGPRGTEYPDAFVYWARRLLQGVTNVAVLDKRDTLSVGGIVLHMHGHDGPNGSKGSRKNLRRIGVKSMIGHGHGAGEDEGCVQVGTSTEDEAEYTNGPGGWSQTHGTINALNKRCLHHIVNGEFHL